MQSRIMHITVSVTADQLPIKLYSNRGIFNCVLENNKICR